MDNVELVIFDLSGTAVEDREKAPHTHLLPSVAELLGRWDAA